MSISYRAGYKYQLARDYALVVPPALRPLVPIKTEFIELAPDGRMLFRRAYAWDGPSGPAIDTKTFMRGSLVHDGVYQLIREMLLPPAAKEPGDRLLQSICLEDGMWAARAWWVYQGVRFGGGPAADPANTKPILVAP